jgi:lipopolysaccharide biosynthesis regulator YciM
MMKKYLDEVKRLYRAERYDDALRAIETAEQSSSISPALLVWKSRCLQLTDNPKGELNEAQSSLERAINVDDEYLPALIDLGYFQLNVMDDAEAAVPLLRQALSISVDNITEVILGLAQCISETNSPNAALAFLQENSSLTIDAAKLEALKNELVKSIT